MHSMGLFGARFSATADSDSARVIGHLGSHVTQLARPTATGCTRFSSDAATV